jgi:hypothetical protein
VFLLLLCESIAWFFGQSCFLISAGSVVGLYWTGVALHWTIVASGCSGCLMCNVLSLL